ncbi:hypothetical protein EYF80_033578 [Liparis tanakae]|uniref:Uncharacterized protein n=1 Tax=Liparis tanakae TaxID=230148 RepID=A0A4Z2GU01_9TELE|nr:hypothetical protein EYF80_033578 [Liparis tanakae]
MAISKTGLAALASARRPSVPSRRILKDEEEEEEEEERNQRKSPLTPTFNNNDNHFLQGNHMHQARKKTSGTFVSSARASTVGGARR